MAKTPTPPKTETEAPKTDVVKVKNKSDGKVHEVSADYFERYSHKLDEVK